MNTYLKRGLVAALGLAGMYASCKKESDGSDTQALKVYTRNENGANQLLTLAFTTVENTPFGKDSVNLVTSVTRPVLEDVQVQYVLDTSLVAAYNQENKTNYMAIPLSAVSMVNDGKLLIKKGQTSSDSTLLVVKKAELLTSPQGYLISLKLKSTNGRDNLISSNRGAYFIAVISNKLNFQLKSSLSDSDVADLNLAILQNGLSLDQSNVSISITPTIELPVDIMASLEKRDSLVKIFNTKHGTSYDPAPEGTYSLQYGGTFQMPKGTNLSQPQQVTATFDASKFSRDASKTYLLPLGVKGYDTARGSVIYFAFTPFIPNINPVNGMPAGRAIDRKAWTVNVSSEDNDNVAANMLDGQTSTVWQSEGYEKSEVVLDMKIQQTNITGILMTPNYHVSQYNIFSMTVYSSDDGLKWRKQGTWETSGNVDLLGTLEKPVDRAVEFYKPINARYLKLSSDYSYDPIGISELNVVK